MVIVLFMLVKRDGRNGEEKWSPVGHNGGDLDPLFCRIPGGYLPFLVFSINSDCSKWLLIEKRLLSLLALKEIHIQEFVLLFF